MKLTIIKATADGEQVSVEWPVPQEFIKQHQAGTRHIRESVSPAFDLIDARLLEMNSRILASNYLINKLTAEARFAVTNVMDVLHGKASGPAVEAILKERQAELEAQQAQAERQAIREKALLDQVKQEMSAPEPSDAPARRARQPKPHPADFHGVDPSIPGGM